MKKSILIIGTVVLSFLSLNATNENKHRSNDILNITKDNIAQVFEWTVETTKGLYAGTALSLQQAKAMIALASKHEIVTGTEITSYLVLKSEINAKRNYFWEVKTTTGHAKGYASTEAYAHKMITLVASGDAVVSKIIISQPQH